MRTTTTFGAAVAALTLAGAASAQTAGEPIDIRSFQAIGDGEGYLASALLGRSVVGTGDETVGEIESLLIGTDGVLNAVVVEGGGIFDIGDEHLRVPYDELSFAPARGVIRAPLDEDNVGDYGLFDGDNLFDIGNVEAGPREFRAGELIGDYVALEDVPTYGYVTDILFRADGTIDAVIVDPASAYAARGYYAYPYYGYDDRYGFDPGQGTYNLPYTEADLADVAPYEPYNRLRGMGTTGAATEGMGLENINPAANAVDPATPEQG